MQSITRRTFHKDYNAAREEQSFNLSNGRTMGFAEYGDLEGTAAFFFHGSPGSRYDGVEYCDVAKKHNVRIICPDRPGHGLSSFQYGRKLGDYPRDVAQLVKHLGIRKYHVFGHSGGGPYVVACAYGLPQDELLNTAVIAGMGAPGVLTVKNAGLYTMAALSLLKWAPGVMRVLVKWSLADDKRLQRDLNHLYKYFGTEEDRAQISSPEAQSSIMATLKAAYAQGPDGVIRDGQIYNTPWDFELRDVEKEIMLFYGCKDDRTPPIFGRYYKEHLPKAELIEFEDASPFTMDKYDEEIMTKIFGTEQAKQTA